MIKRVAIVGAGTAGMASAVFLSRLGCHVTVYEKIHQPSAVGAGILVQPTGLSVLNELDLKDAMAACGSVIHRLDGRTRSGRPVIDLNYSDLYDGCYGLGVHRASLFSLLHQTMLDAGVSVHTGQKVVAYSELADGVCVQTEGAAVSTPYDLLLVCNGARSKLRQGHAALRLDKPYPWGALWAIVDKPDGLADQCLKQMYHTASYMSGLLPSGRLHGQGNELMSFFWSIPVDHHPKWQAREVDFQAWKQKVHDLWPAADAVLAQLTSPEQLAFASYRDVVMRRWASGRVVFMGDAAHSMSPQLGQGANLALCDASALYHCIKAGGGGLQALALYNQTRAGHIQFYQNMSRLLTPFYQSHRRSYAWLRDALSWPLTQIPWLRHQMLATLVGIKNGWLSEMAAQQLSRETDSEPLFAPAALELRLKQPSMNREDS